MSQVQKEWYTLQELSKMFGIPYSKVRAAVFVLKNQNTIMTRDNPIDRRVMEVHRDSLEAVKQGAGIA